MTFSTFFKEVETVIEALECAVGIDNVESCLSDLKEHKRQVEQAKGALSVPSLSGLSYKLYCDIEQLDDELEALVSKHEQWLGDIKEECSSCIFKP